MSNFYENKFYENKIGPSGLPIGIGSKGNTVQFSDDRNPFYSPAIKDLKRASDGNPFYSPAIRDFKRDSLTAKKRSERIAVLNKISNAGDSLTAEKRSVEERIAVLKAEIKRQRNLKDAADSPLMEIALHRFKAYGDPSGLNDIANRQQTSDMAKLQKDEADAAAMKDKENTLRKSAIIADNAKDTLARAKRNTGENSDESHTALQNYNLARYEVIKAAKDLKDEEQLKKYSEAYPEIGKSSTTPTEATGVESGDAKKDHVIIAENYRKIANDPKKSAHDIAKELVGKGKIKDMSSEKWIALKKELNGIIEARYAEEKNAYNRDQSNKKSKELFEAYAAALAKDDLDAMASIFNDLKNRGFTKEDINSRIVNKKYPTFNNFKEPVEPILLD